MRLVVRALMRHEIADEIAAAGGNNGEPVSRILLELRLLEGIDLVADVANDIHVRLLKMSALTGREGCKCRQRQFQHGPAVGHGRSLALARKGMLRLRSKYLRVRF